MKAARLVAVALSLSMIFSACVSMHRNVPDTAFVEPAACPPQQSLVGQGKPNSGTEVLTLEQCIEIARANNPGLAAGAWDVQTALAQRDNAASERWPNFRGVGSYTSYVQNQRLVPVRKNNDPGMFSSSIVAGDIILRMPLFTGGRIRSEISAADLLSQAATQRLARTWEELIFNVSSTFYTILGQQPVIESLQFSIKALNKQLQRAVDMMRVGKAAKVDVLRTEVRISDVEQRLVREQTVLDIQRRLLTTLMGIGDDRGPLKPQGELRALRPVPDLNGALAMAYAERGDYKAARSSVDSQAMKLAAARAQRWPRLSLEGSYGTRYAAGITDNAAAFINRFVRTPAPLGQGKEFYSPGVSPSLPVGNIGVVADYPIFDGGKITSQVREQESRLASTQQNLRKLELQIRLDVETGLLNVDSARKRVLATRKAIEQAKESFRIETEKYDLGKGSITDVLDAQAAMLDAQTNHYRALADYSIALAQLGLATGEKR
ncbi:MAG TPA: TolC family protein [Desulfomonilaceae bacterium]|nr:TolC family protein [Desulfomonilaceae bacterium]